MLPQIAAIALVGREVRRQGNNARSILQIAGGAGMLNIANFVKFGCSCALIVALSSCTRAPSRRGLDLMSTGDCKAAVELMTPSAQDGDLYSLNNMGVIWRKGCLDAGMQSSYVNAFEDFFRAAQGGVPIAFSNLGSIYESGIYEGNYAIPPNIAAAVDAYTHGARFGDQGSIDALTRLGQPVPAADIQDQQAQARHREQLNIALMAVGFAAIAEGGHSQGTVHTVPLPSSTPRIVPSTTGVAGPRCWGDYDCADGGICVRPTGQGAGGVGVCAKPVNRVGVPVLTPHTINSHPIASCQFDTQCPFTYSCKKISPSDLSGVCTK